MKLKTLLATIGPGILVAATGVGAGDLATATFTGTKLGTAILWAVVVGAVLKYVLNEGLTRWQLATGTTLIEGTVRHLGRWASWGFLLYLLLWSYLVAMALMSACGVALHAIFPVFEEAAMGKIVLGSLQSVLAVLLIRRGGYALFEKCMSLCIGVMFVVVVVTAVALGPNLGEVVTGLLWLRIPDFRGEGLAWTIALLGGVGGTVTVLCYGYWIREEGRTDGSQLSICRLDLAVGYTMTALFGIAMVIIGARIGEVDGKGATLVINIADTLQNTFPQGGVLLRWAFLIGAWGAFFSSLLGVWQATPYLFADLWGLMNRPSGVATPATVDTSSTVYQSYLWGIALLPISGLFLLNFQSAVKVYAFIGAFFIPLLAIVLLLLNGNSRLVGENFRNRSWETGLLWLTLVTFLMAGGFQIVSLVL